MTILRRTVTRLTPGRDGRLVRVRLLPGGDVELTPTTRAKQWGKRGLLVVDVVREMPELRGPKGRAMVVRLVAAGGLLEVHEKGLGERVRVRLADEAVGAFAVRPRQSVLAVWWRVKLAEAGLDCGRLRGRRR